MKRAFLALQLLCPFIAAKQMHYQAINSPELQFVDGTTRINILKIINFRKNLRELHFLTQSIEFNGKKYSIKQLTDMERDGNLTGNDFVQTFASAIKRFADLAVPYMQDAEGSENLIKKLVKQWSIQRNRPYTLLLEWSELTHHAQVVFYKNIKSFTDLTHFLEDLETFLGDLIQSCPKSLEQIKKAQKQH